MGRPTLLAAAVEPTLGTAHLDEPLAVNVISAGGDRTERGGGRLGLSAAARRRVVQIAHRLLRQCWGTWEWVDGGAAPGRRAYRRRAAPSSLWLATR